MKKISLFFLLSCLFLFIISPALAVDLGVDAGKNQRLDREKSSTTRTSEEKRKSSGQKTSETRTSGSEHQDQNIIKRTSQEMKNSSLDLTLSLGDVFGVNMALMENNNPKLKYKLFSKPRKPADFGLSAELAPGVIDSIKSDLLGKAAASNCLVSTVGGSNEKLRQYKNAVALYSVIIGQAYLYLSSDLAALGNTGQRDKNGAITINRIGYDDLLTLAEGALIKATNKITDKRLKKIYQAIIMDKTPCRFAGTITSIQCGLSVFEVGNNPKLTALGMILYGNGRYGGFEATYKVSSGWSYNQAVDHLKTTSKYKKMAQEVSDYADSMTAKGRAREAVMAKKLAWSRAKSGKAGLSLGKFIPGF